MTNSKVFSGLALGLLCVSAAAWGGDDISYHGVLHPNRNTVKRIAINHGPTVVVFPHNIENVEIINADAIAVGKTNSKGLVITGKPGADGQAVDVVVSEKRLTVPVILGGVVIHGTKPHSYSYSLLHNGSFLSQHKKLD